MKKIFLILVGCLLLSCTKTNNTEGLSGDVTVQLITDATGYEDRSFNQSAWEGILSYYGDDWRSMKNKGKLYDILASFSDEEYVPNIDKLSKQKPSLIITTGFTFADALTEVSANYPQQKYMIIDVDWVNRPNVMQAIYAEHEGSYLVGVAIALKAVQDGIDNPTFGFVGGIAGPTITKFEVGYMQGILSIIPYAKFVDYYVGDWVLPEPAQKKAEEWYDQGVYAIYSAAGGSGLGVIAQTIQERLAGNNVWTIGVDSDQYETGLYAEGKSAVFTSMIKKVDTSVVYALNSIEKNQFKGEVIVFDLQSDGVGYSTMNTALTKDIQAKLVEIRNDIISGDIVVYDTYEESKKIISFPQNLGAID